MTGASPDGPRDVARWRGHRRESWPLAMWPEPDRRAWERAVGASDDLSEDGGAGADWRPATRRSAVWAYGRWLAHLHATGALDPAAEPAARVTPEAVAGYLAAREGKVTPVTLMSSIAMLIMVMMALTPDHDWAWLKEVHGLLQIRAIPMRDKRPRILAATDLFDFGVELMSDAEAAIPADGTPAPMAAALAFRDGLMISLLASRPLRRLNFLGIEIGRQLVRERGGWQLRFTAAEMKNHQRLELPFPRALEGALLRYLEHWRPRILAVNDRRRAKLGPQGRPAGSYLWVTMEGGALSTPGLRVILCGRTLARFGVPVTAHLFRDCAATSIAAQDPDHVRIAAQLLGHRSLQTTARYYVIADNRASIGKHQDRIRALRRGQHGRGRGDAPRS
ncbi:hypothetical protein [Falsiroseomonas sp. CW058]|uniref:hypothetical protein n=1 Tax=Falsiroseomonas sp. CW058 TaxID=3388664 RepID=UPI003D31E89A